MNKSASIAPSRIFREGRFGIKSFPTKKQRKIKSSINLSKSNWNFIGIVRNSSSKYSLTTFTFSKENSISAIDLIFCSAFGFSFLHSSFTCPVLLKFNKKSDKNIFFNLT